jgi:protein-disulfide isomerase-like protein with CxxC motif
MPRMIDLIRESKMPSNLMRAAAKGALSLPPDEMIEILVYLTTNPVFCEQAKMTLAGWDEASSLAAAASPQTPREVLDYLIAPENRRPKLFPALLENPSVPEEPLVELAQVASREVVDVMLRSARVRQADRILHALATNAHLNEAETALIQAALEANSQARVAQPLAPAAAEAPAEAETGDEEVAKFVVEHAAEIAAEEGKSFELVGGVEALEADAAVLETQPAVPAAVAVAVAEPAPEAASAVPDAEIQSRFAAVKSAKTTQLDRRSALQKIQQMSVAERISLAFKGNKEERFILIRDGCKLVSQAVLESPKVSEAEIESFASMKNVQESVLRTISMKHRFMKNYSIVRALVNNPRAPLDLSLALMKHLLVNDLKNLSMNKNVPDTLRKMAYKNYKMKSAPAGSKAE